MIKLENVGLASPEQMEFIIEGMRNPMNSWEKSDSGILGDPFSEGRKESFSLGGADYSLMLRLSNAGTEHRKYMRMMPVYVRITAPLYWWKEFDTYSVGVAPNPTDIIMNSCSTMHKIAEKEFTVDDFSHEHLLNMANNDAGDALFLNDKTNIRVDGEGLLWLTIDVLNYYRGRYIKTKDKSYWWQMIQLLPSSYNQTRNVKLNYEVLANIYRQRKNHKLDEWREFCKWIASLPYSELIVDQGVDYCRKTLGCLSPMLEPGYAYAQNECINPDVGKISKDTDRDTLPKKAIFGSPMGQGGKYDI